jgi:hypothetical protein
VCKSQNPEPIQLEAFDIGGKPQGNNPSGNRGISFIWRLSHPDRENEGR